MSDRDWQQVMPGYRERWQQRYGTSGDNWENDEASYQYGWQMRNDPRYKGRQWTEVEPEFRRDWETRYRDRPWDRAGRGVREAWEGANEESATRGAQTTDRDRTLELREEELRANKESVESGAVRLHKEVVSEQRTMEVPVTHEEVTIERQAVDRRPSDRPIGEGGETVRVPVRREEVSVDKRAVVTEEVEVGKRAVQETQNVSGTVRREELKVEREGDLQVDDTGTERRTRRSDEPTR